MFPSLHLDWTQADSNLQALDKLGLSSAILCLDPHLCSGDSIPEDRFRALLRLAQSLVRERPSLHLIWVLPLGIQPDWIRQIQNTHSFTTQILCPLLWGFGDQNLFDQALNFYKNKPGALLQSVASREVPMCFMGDVAGLVATLPHREPVFGKIIRIPAALQNIQSFRLEFVRAFAPRPSFIERLAAKLANERLGDGACLALTLDYAPESLGQIKVEDFESLFPTALSETSRVLKSAAKQYERNPDLKLHFPPGRAL